MDKRIILAVAGAGKTYHITHEINPCERNLILAFTNENINNIKRELVSAFGGIPALTTVMTFHSFVYEQVIMPYEPSIAEYFACPGFVSNGPSVCDPPQTQIIRNGQAFRNSRYINKDNLGHYVTANNQYYISLITELALEVKRDGTTLAKRAAEKTNILFDKVLIDEFQDFRQKDYDFLLAFTRHLNCVLMVGDYYQHSVSGRNNSGKPFKQRKKEIDYDTFIESLRSNGFLVDTKTLSKSRRCAGSVCEFVSNKLKINISSYDEHEGNIIWLSENDEIIQILQDESVLKLVYKDSAKYNFNSMNWSYSKGNTVDSVCVILTDAFKAMDSDFFSVDTIPAATINKLYVALTRSSKDVYIIKKSLFDNTCKSAGFVSVKTGACTGLGVFLR
jgi:DNA helicase-2/ATP-dependent DNA helicase PcrA